jgi:hypothetical protein
MREIQLIVSDRNIYIVIDFVEHLGQIYRDGSID